MIAVVIGTTGIGKTTYFAKMAHKALKKGIHVYSNTYIEGTYILDPKMDLN